MEYVRLGDYVNIKTGKLDANAATNDGLYPFFTCSKEISRIDKYSYDTECVLVAGNGDLNVKYYNGKFDAYQRTYIIENNQDSLFYVKYIYYFMCRYIYELKKQTVGGIIKFIKLGNLTEARIPLLSKKEQLNVISLFEKINCILESKTRELTDLDTLIKSQFIEMFGDSNNSKGYPIIQVGDYCDKIQVGIVIKPSKYYVQNGGVKSFRSLNAGELYVKDENWVEISLEGNRENSKSILNENDVVIVRSGNPGTSCVIPKKYSGYNAIDLIIARVNQNLCNSYYLSSFTNFEHGMKQIKEGTGGAAQQHFNVSKYSKMKIFDVEKKYQDQFAAIVEQIDKSKSINKMSLILQF